MRDKLKYFTVRSHMDQQSEIRLPPDPFKKQLDIVSSELRKTIRGNADIIKAASRFGVYPSTIYKLMDGRPLSLSVKKKGSSPSRVGENSMKKGLSTREI